MIKRFIHMEVYGDTVTIGGLLENIEVSKPSVNMARLVCGFLLHIILLPEIESAKSMLDFCKRNPMNFRG